MKLLPLFFIKDAAQSVKRICKESFTKVQNSVLIELLGVATPDSHDVLPSQRGRTGSLSFMVQSGEDINLGY